jgi:hypothetical protein
MDELENLEKTFGSKEAHFSAITCLFYPASISSEKYDSDIIWIGSKDFSVKI